MKTALETGPVRRVTAYVLMHPEANDFDDPCGPHVAGFAGRIIGTFSANFGTATVSLYVSRGPLAEDRWKVPRQPETGGDPIPTGPTGRGTCSDRMADGCIEALLTTEAGRELGRAGFPNPGYGWAEMRRWLESYGYIVVQVV